MRTWLAEAGPRLAAKFRDRLTDAQASDDGDVPGWVMVTLMSAALVAVIFVLARDQLTTILSDALDTVLP